MGEGRKEVGRFASLWLCISEHQRKRERERGGCEKTPKKITPREKCRSVLLSVIGARAMQAFNPGWFTYCSVRHSCTWHKVFFTNTNPAALTRGERSRGAEAAPLTRPCTASQIGHYIDLNRFLVCMNSPVRRRRREGKKKTMFPLHGFILIFIVALRHESTNVTENGLDICSHSLLFLSLHPSFSLSLFPLLCSPDACCLLLPEKKRRKKTAVDGWRSEWGGGDIMLFLI